MVVVVTRIITIVMLSTLNGAAFAVAKPQVVGINAAVLNDVRISNAIAPQPRPAVLRQRVALADKIQTGQRSQLQVLLLDKSVFTVGANARLTIDRYIYDPNGGRSFTASVAKGAFRFMSGRSDRGGNSSINTPIAAIGIRGTLVDGVVGADAIAIASGERAIDGNIRSDPATASLIILRGPGRRTQGNVLPGAITVTAGGRTVALDQPMLAAYVPAPGMAPIGPFAISLEGLARVQDLIFPSLAEHFELSPPITASPVYRPSSPYGGPVRPIPPGAEPGEGGALPPYGQDVPLWQPLPGLQRPPRDMPSAETPTRPQSTTPPRTTGSQTAPPTTTPAPSRYGKDPAQPPR